MDTLEKATTETEILSALQSIEGPFAFVYYRASLKKVYFGRDCLGRRSLLWLRSETGAFMLSSVGKAKTHRDDADGWEEVPANGFYCIDLNVDFITTDNEENTELPKACGIPLQLFPWTYVQNEDKLDMLSQGRLVRKMSYCLVLGLLIHRQMAELSFPQIECSITGCRGD